MAEARSLHLNHKHKAKKANRKGIRVFPSKFTLMIYFFQQRKSINPPQTVPPAGEKEFKYLR